jgi:hypothetical protein
MNPGDMVVIKPDYTYADLYDEEGWTVRLPRFQRGSLNPMLCLETKVDWSHRDCKRPLMKVLVEGVIVYVAEVCCEKLGTS